MHLYTSVYMLVHIYVQKSDDKKKVKVHCLYTLVHCTPKLLYTSLCVCMYFYTCVRACIHFVQKSEEVKKETVHCLYTLVRLYTCVR